MRQEKTDRQQNSRYVRQRREVCCGLLTATVELKQPALRCLLFFFGTRRSLPLIESGLPCDRDMLALLMTKPDGD